MGKLRKCVLVVNVVLSCVDNNQQVVIPDLTLCHFISPYFYSHPATRSTALPVFMNAINRVCGSTSDSTRYPSALLSVASVVTIYKVNICLQNKF